MNRRKLLQVAGATFATGIGTGYTGARQDGGENDEPADEPPEECFCDPEIQFGEQELLIDESGFTPDAYAVVEVENAGDTPTSELTVSVSWLDEDGQFVGDDSERLPSLAADELWRAYVWTITDPEEIDDFELSGEFEVGQPRTPSGLTIADSNFDYGENEITGVVENSRDSDIERVKAHGKMFDDGGTVLGGGSTWEREHPAGRDWNFDIRVPRLPGGVEPTEHEVMLDARTFQIQG